MNTQVSAWAFPGKYLPTGVSTSRNSHCEQKLHLHKEKREASQRRLHSRDWQAIPEDVQSGKRKKKTHLDMEHFVPEDVNKIIFQSRITVFHLSISDTARTYQWSDHAGPWQRNTDSFDKCLVLFNRFISSSVNCHRITTAGNTHTHTRTEPLKSCIYWYCYTQVVISLLPQGPRWHFPQSCKTEWQWVEVCEVPAWVWARPARPPADPWWISNMTNMPEEAHQSPLVSLSLFFFPAWTAA